MFSNQFANIFEFLQLSPQDLTLKSSDTLTSRQTTSTLFITQAPLRERDRERERSKSWTRRRMEVWSVEGDTNVWESEIVAGKKERGWTNKWDFTLVPSHGNMKERKKRRWTGTDMGGWCLNLADETHRVMCVDRWMIMGFLSGRKPRDWASCLLWTGWLKAA